MNKLYTYALMLLAATSLISCESETSEPNSSTDRALLSSGKQLTIINNSDFTMTGKIYCYGAQNNISVNPNILITGNAIVPANYEITYKNFADATNVNYRITPWRVVVNQETPLSYTGTHTNQLYGQFYNQISASPSKYANWRYLKVEMTTTSIPGFTTPVTMDIELPYYSNNNSGVAVVDLSPYGLHKDLHITQSSFINQTGNAVLKLDSELIDQPIPLLN
jgi:hypothetical protein